MRLTLKHILSFSLLLLFGWFWSGSQLLYHTHIIEGYSISHSHHCSADASQGHTHSARQLVTIAKISWFVALAIETLCIIMAREFINLCPDAGPAQTTPHQSPSVYALRGPPAI